MKREISPIHLALYLILGCILCRLISNYYPSLMPNISPLMAVSFIGAMYLPRRWGWIVGPVILLITDLAFLKVNYLVDGSMFSWWTFLSLCIYAAAGALGILISYHKSLTKIICGSLACSLLFYVASNTFSWWTHLAPQSSPGYEMSLAGLWQANTVGLPGWIPTWLFLRNAMAGDLFFVLLLLLVLDRRLLLGRAGATTATHAA